MGAPRWVFISMLVLVFGRGAIAESGDSIEAKVGQLFIIGIQQSKVDPALRSVIHDLKPGGVILFRRNLNDLKAIRSFTKNLRSEIASATGHDPFLAVDQEGGSVIRIPVFPSLPPPTAVGRAGDESIARDFGQESGRILRWCGLNMNLAPVLDLSNPENPSFIGSRSYGDDPVLAGRLGTAHAEGLRGSGILPTAKHFPGLGSTVVDPHTRLAKSSSTDEQMQTRDLLPFEAYSSLGENSALMVSGLSYPALDPSGQPAPFSRPILHDLLRSKIGYEGLAITDDLQMKGTSLVLSPSEAALRSLQAGADLVMISWSVAEQKKAVQRVAEAVKSGEWPVEELNRRVERILRIKTFLSSFGEPSRRIGRGPRGEPATRELEKLDLRLLDRNLRASEAALSRGQGELCVIAAKRDFLDSFRRGERRRSVRYLELAAGEKVAALTGRLNGCVQIVFAVNGKSTARILAGLPPKILKRTVLVNLSLPSLVTPTLALKSRIELGHAHVHAGFRVAQRLEQSRRPAQD